MQRFFQEKVLPLLKERYEEIEAIWQHHPLDPIAASAVTVKEFMEHRQISSPSAGVLAYLAFKQEQARLLAELGLAPDQSEDPSASSPLLTSQVA